LVWINNTNQLRLADLFGLWIDAWPIGIIQVPSFERVDFVDFSDNSSYFGLIFIFIKMNKKNIIIIIAIILIIAGGLYFYDFSAPSSNSNKQESVSGFLFVEPTTEPSIKNQPQSPPPGTMPVATHSVSMINFSFNPKILTINKGDSVVWTNQDSAPHNVGIGGSESPILSNGQTFVFVFDNSGTFDYYCPLHPSMKGTIIVK